MALIGTLNPTNDLGFRNKIINGDFRIWQRGTSFSNPSGSYTADRWLAASGGTVSGDTLSQQSHTVGQTDVPGEPQYFFRFAAGATTNNRVWGQRIEDVRTLAGQTITLSFYAKANTNHSSTIEYSQNFGSGGSSSVAFGTTSYSLTTSWQRFTFTTAAPSISGKTIGTSSYLEINVIRSLSAASVTIDISNIQLELGSIATPFENRPYGLELALCQRYYETSYDPGIAPGSSPGNVSYSRWSNNGTANALEKWFRVTKRGTPTVNTFDNNGASGKIRIFDGTTDPSNITPTAIAATMNSMYVTYNANANGMQFNYTASAEL